MVSCRIQRTFCYITLDLVRVFYFVFVNSIQSKKGSCYKSLLFDITSMFEILCL